MRADESDKSSAIRSASVITIDELPRREPASGQLRLRVKAAGVGRWDAHLRGGKIQLESLPLILGSELCPKGSVRRLANPGRFGSRLEPPRHQREKGESQRRGKFADGIADQNMRRDRPGHLKEDPGVGPLPESREPPPEQRTDCEDLPDSDNIQDVSWISDGADVLYNKGKVR